MVVGFLLILRAWDGAAELDFLQGQFPFLLSASIPGLAMIIVGAGLEYVQTLRQITAARARQMAVLNTSVSRLTEFVRNGAMAPATVTPALQTAGGGGTGVLPAPGTTDDPTLVVAGRSSFHSLTCHLVADRDDLPPVPRMYAEAQGLNPCRVCKP
jgi:hypothetical protein